MGNLVALAFLALLLESATRLGRRLWPEDAASLQLAQGSALVLCSAAAASGLLSLLGSLRPFQLQLLSWPWIVLWLRPAFPAQLGAIVQQLQPRSRGLLVAASALTLAGALAPTTHVDTHVYHYTLARLYLQHGGVYWSDTGVYDGLFHGLHLLDAWALGCAGEAAANLLSPLFLFILVAALGESDFTGVGWLALSSPLLMLQSSGGLSDLPAAALCALAYRQADSQPSRWQWLWSAAALHIRLTALLPLVALALAHPRRGLHSLLWACLSCLPWLAFNTYHTGNPLFPIGFWRTASLLQIPLAAVLAGAGVAVLSLLLLRRQLGRAIAMVCGLLALLQLPHWDASGRSWQLALSPLLIGGVILALTREAPGRAQMAGIWLCLLFPIKEVRYFLPVQVWLFAMAAKGWRSAGGGMLNIIIAAGLLSGLAGWLGSLWARLPVVLGATSREAYYARRMTLYPAFQWLRAHNHSSVFLSDPRAYLCPLEFRVALQFPRPEVLAGLSPRTPEGALRTLRADRCDLILWNFQAPDVAYIALQEALSIAAGDAERLRNQIIAEGPLQDLLQRWPELQGRGPFRPQRIQDLRLQQLYRASCRSPILYSRDGVVIVAWPDKL